jgi:hypothetical protein
MSHREFLDQDGRAWEVWEVHPSAPGAREGAPHAPPVAPSLRNGWLAFRCESERRRIVPVPNSWERLSEDDLRLLLEQATLVPDARRLIE